MNRYTKITSAIALILMVCSPAAADDSLSSSASLTISATVGSVLSLTITPTEAANSLELYSANSNTTVENLLVATAVRISNNRKGHIISYCSEYGGLKNSTADEIIEYTFTYGTNNQKHSSSKTTKTKVKKYNNPTSGSGASDEIRITYDKGPYPTGTYTDTITFTIEEK